MRRILLLGLLLGGPAAVAAPDPPLLVLLTETGEERDGLPVLAVHPGAEETAAALSRGVSGILIRVYGRLQHWRAASEGVPPEPAYVLLSTRQGGFARRGFYLGSEDKSGVDFVDVHRDWPAAGEFGALDQIVPHELAHAVRRQLVGPLAEGSANQVHALGVRTDRVTAFNEGFAEHFQAMAIDHPDADPSTRALADDREAPTRVEARLDAYRRELTATLAVAPRMRMGFVLWYSNGEDVLRYFAVKANAFRREPELPEHLLSRRDPYAAYLLESVLPGDPEDPLRSTSRAIATEGVVSSLFHRWATDEGLRNAYRDDAFYEPFGVDAGQVEPLENVYLKLFSVFAAHRPQDVLEVIAGYRESFPDEERHVGAVVAEVLGAERPQVAAEIWLANPGFETGTTIFDQYRGLPRVHTFDLNAASVVDLAGVPGVDPELARAIRDAAPFAGIDDLAAVPGVGTELVARFHELQREMAELRETFDEDDEGDLSIQAILLPFLWRGLAVLAAAALLASVLYRSVRGHGPSPPPSWLRTAMNGIAAALLSAGVYWAVGMSWTSPAAVGVLFGMPAALWCLKKTGLAPAAWNVLAAWLVAALPAVVLTAPWL